MKISQGGWKKRAWEKKESIEQKEGTAGCCCREISSQFNAPFLVVTHTSTAEITHRWQIIRVCVCVCAVFCALQPTGSTFKCLRHLRSNLVTLSSWQMKHLIPAVRLKEPTVFAPCWCIIYSKWSRSLLKNNACTETIQCMSFFKGGQTHSLRVEYVWETKTTDLAGKSENHREHGAYLCTYALKDLVGVFACCRSSTANSTLA